MTVIPDPIGPGFFSSPNHKEGRFSGGVTLGGGLVDSGIMDHGTHFGGNQT